MLEKSLILFGGGSPLIVEYEELCQLNDITITAIVNNMPGVKNHSTKTGIQITPDMLSTVKDKYFLCPLFTPNNRYLATNEALQLGLLPYKILNFSGNLLPLDFQIGIGAFINKGVICGASSTLGNHVLINRGATLGHHLFCEDYVSIGPGVTTGGNVTIKRGALLGTGCIIAPKVTIGEHAIVGAGSVVVKDVAPNEIVVGNPAKKLKIVDGSF